VTGSVACPLLAKQIEPTDLKSNRLALLSGGRMSLDDAE
jgi:hypothetical protein